MAPNHGTTQAKLGVCDLGVRFGALSRLLLDRDRLNDNNGDKCVSVGSKDSVVLAGEEVKPTPCVGTLRGETTSATAPRMLRASGTADSVNPAPPC